MSLLVRKLREYDEGPPPPSLKKRLMMEAADEIERLRDALQIIVARAAWDYQATPNEFADIARRGLGT